MRTQHISSLTPLRDVLARVAALARPVAARETVLADAAGRVLAEDVRAFAPWPAAPIALRDGWAVQADAVADAGPYAPMPLSIAPAWVDAGDALSRDADAVLPADAVTVTGDTAEAYASTIAGDGVLAVGADAAAGQVLRQAGETLRAADIAALQAARVARVMVRAPRIRVVSVGADPAVVAIARAVAAHGADAVLAQSLEHAFTEDADAVIAIGGTGEGRTDESVTRLARAGTVDIHGIGLSPGEACALGSIGTRPVLLLPARLDAALAAFLVVGDALLRGLTGGPISWGMPVTLSRKIVSTVGLAEMVPVRRVADGVEPLASGYWPMHAIAGAHGWVLVPSESEGYGAGARLEMRSFP
jgi:molybdopterin molybdotransferase